MSNKLYLTEEAAEQSEKKSLELKLLQDDLVRRRKKSSVRGKIYLWVFLS